MPSDTDTIALDAPRALDLDRARADFQRDGAYCVRNVFSPEWLDLVRRGLRDCSASPSSQSKTWTDGRGTFFQDSFAWRRIEALRTFVFDSPAAKVVGSLMGSSAVHLYMDHLLMREPQTVLATPWHHDTPYCQVDGRDFCTLWLPLDPIAMGDGLRLVRGSHTWGRMFLPVNFNSSTPYDKASSGASADVIPDIDARPDAYTILSWDLQPGDCIVFYCNMLHSAPAHLHSGRTRWVYSTRWTGDDARFVTRDWLVPPLPVDCGLAPGDPIGGPLFPRIDF